MNGWNEWVTLEMYVRKKVCHKLKDILVMVLFTTLANVDAQAEMEFEYTESDRNISSKSIHEEKIFMRLFWISKKNLDILTKMGYTIYTCSTKDSR